MIESPQLARAIERIAMQSAPIRDALNAADRELGDGDTGMTIAQVIAGWLAVATTLPGDVGEALVVLGRETGRASGSSLGAVLATGLSAAGRAMRGRTALDRDGIAAAMAAAGQKIAERSGAVAGAKTVLDSLLRIERDARAASRYGLDDAIASCRAALDEFRDRAAMVGRARMYGDRSKGHDDPGMLAALLILQASKG
jgi:dihydroxyacetone kinase